MVKDQIVGVELGSRQHTHGCAGEQAGVSELLRCISVMPLGKFVFLITIKSKVLCPSPRELNSFEFIPANYIYLIANALS